MVLGLKICHLATLFDGFAKVWFQKKMSARKKSLTQVQNKWDKLFKKKNPFFSDPNFVGSKRRRDFWILKAPKCWHTSQRKRTMILYLPKLETCNHTLRMHQYAHMYILAIKILWNLQSCFAYAPICTYILDAWLLWNLQSCFAYAQICTYLTRIVTLKLAMILCAWNAPTYMYYPGCLWQSGSCIVDGRFNFTK
jgi:hypothetical protein